MRPRFITLLAVVCAWLAHAGRTESAARVRERFDRSGKSVLLVGHSLAGARLVEALLGWEPTGRFNIANAEISELHQLSAGTFRLVALNGRVQQFKMPPGRKP